MLILLHALHVIRRKSRKVCLVTVDTDSIIFSVANCVWYFSVMVSINRMRYCFFFHENGKKSACEPWKCYSKGTEVFLALSNPVDWDLSDNSTSVTERSFV